jgi:hypothetical protein
MVGEWNEHCDCYSSIKLVQIVLGFRGDMISWLADKLSARRGAKFELYQHINE